MVRLVEHSDAARLTANEWVELLLADFRIGNAPDLIFPSFPSEEVQRQFVGSAFRDAMMEALRFYNLVHEGMNSSRFRRCSGRNYLDFGCGWGRFSRLFLRDFPPEDMFGVDIDEEMIAFCAGANLPGKYKVINQSGLELEPSSFRLVTAYSVFTHLPPKSFAYWLDQIARIMAPGAILALTVEPARFLDFIDRIDPKDASPWHQGLAKHKPDIPDHRKRLAEEGITYLATGGGGVRTPDIYGDTIVNKDYLVRQVHSFGRVISYVDEPSRFWQAAALIQKAT